nr:MAG TPA: hypothetical protein [Caudoviricetes sp.]
MPCTRPAPDSIAKLVGLIIESSRVLFKHIYFHI